MALREEILKLKKKKIRWKKVYPLVGSSSLLYGQQKEGEHRPKRIPRRYPTEILVRSFCEGLKRLCYTEFTCVAEGNVREQNQKERKPEATPATLAEERNLQRCAV